MNVIIVTACPSGMATTFLAARRLEQAARRHGWNPVIDMHSELEAGITLSESQLDAAELVIVAASPVASAGLERFVGMQVHVASIEEALPDPEAFLAMAESRARRLESADLGSIDLTKSGLSSAVPENVGTTTQTAAKSVPSIVAVTACPTGVAHTFMAAEALSEAGRALGYPTRVETQGSVGAQDALTEQEIADADVVILACDIEVDPTRFAGKRVWRTSTSTALKKPRDTIEEAFEGAQVQPAGGEKQGSGQQQGEKRGPYKHLLTGVSFMLPMVVAGGLMIALSFIFGIKAFEEEGTLAAALMQIGGGAAFKLMIPVLAGYIAYSIADRPGITPGMIGGLLASTLDAGFLGGIIAGFLAGYTALGLSRYVKLPQSIESLKPILIIPLVASLITGLVMIYVVGTPVAGLMSALTNYLESMGSANAVLLGILLGAMMCFDLGGPVNKAAYAFGVGLLASETYAPMAAIMAAGMVPALGMGLASFIARNKFAVPEREAGKASFVLGLCFISEGAIPFAAKDPLRVIPSCMAGGAVTGALSMLVGAKLVAPHGGLFVLLIPNAINVPLLYLGAIVAGTLITGIGYAMLKKGAQQVETAAVS
ncbi:PTS fructose-like transporter subunit IIB [Cobetia crustatorum]|uniref:protein-N(pi)-phosphohistidine--D-fructose phosphotransferase n=1 Tax=Cobetia crustatorum TaxID=553385 RepID=A0A558HFA2_9GAMM|nr:PTS fructose-like transporter subunit IIB [Cobetia crustatorum]TVU67821.1 PTS fructose-like transporter subunit IIB [Cobetia crustatorum]